MDTVQLATRVDRREDELFRENTRRLGITPADAMRIFIAVFNRHRGFPFDVRLDPSVEPFDTESEATDFASRYSHHLLHETQ